MKYIVVVSLLVLSAAALPADVYKTEWDRFKKNYNKLYGTQDEEDMRFKIFSKRLDEIAHHNNLYEKGDTTYKMGVNQFTDWTDEEMRSLMGVIVPPDTKIYGESSCELEWRHFKKTYNKLYETEGEEKKRYTIFCANLRKIQYNNKLFKEGIVSSKMGVNKFTDLTIQEMEEERMGLKHKKHVVIREAGDFFQIEWNRFKDTYNKKYDSDNEDQRRYKIFSKNLKKIISHNKLYENGETTYKMGVNQFTDMTSEEMRKYMGVLIKPSQDENRKMCSTEWKNFKNTYEKLYTSEQEEQYRFNVFCKNLEEITDHNKLFNEGETTYKMGINEFTDLTSEEMSKRMGLLNPSAT